MSDVSNYHLQSMSKDDLQELDEKIIKIAAPHQISRLSRLISCRNDWKAREWENYVLYYSVPLLTEHISRNHLSHWLLFVESLFILLQSSINIKQLDNANKMLHEFVAKCVLNWGPLWCQSTFSFESANQTLLKAIKCSKGVTLQILRYINMNHMVSIVQERVYPDANELVQMYCNDILGVKVIKFCKLTEITYFGIGDCVSNDVLNTVQLSQNSAKVFFKMVKDGCLYESSIKLKRRSNNSFAQLRNNTFIRILKFIVHDQTNQELTVCNLLNTRHRFTNHYRNLQVIERICDEQIIVPTNEIMTVCVVMKILGTMYICSVPNLLHY
ncbi:uncharacterized protein LOC116416702 isoform X1 [Nasonia vitripennis]|uniref:Uncharacterized protein n=1 Tax=Nasonia vitripennis TaxID=7425 RepID=A0A7M7Q6V4_NASVI|nr:uncharacterized protein LOC116416702 isoform X1 [Nasonia vitripennis]